MTTGRINQVTTLTQSKPPRVCGGLKGAAAAVPTGRQKHEALSRLRLLGRARKAETVIPLYPHVSCTNQVAASKILRPASRSGRLPTPLKGVESPGSWSVMVGVAEQAVDNLVVGY